MLYVTMLYPGYIIFNLVYLSHLMASDIHTLLVAVIVFGGVGGGGGGGGGMLSWCGRIVCSSSECPFGHRILVCMVQYIVS